MNKEKKIEVVLRPIIWLYMNHKDNCRKLLEDTFKIVCYKRKYVLINLITVSSIIQTINKEKGVRHGSTKICGKSSARDVFSIGRAVRAVREDWRFAGRTTK